jgi:hypothetical protein
MMQVGNQFRTKPVSSGRANRNIHFIYQHFYISTFSVETAGDTAGAQIRQNVVINRWCSDIFLNRCFKL